MCASADYQTRQSVSSNKLNHAEMKAPASTGFSGTNQGDGKDPEKSVPSDRPSTCSEMERRSQRNSTKAGTDTFAFMKVCLLS